MLGAWLRERREEQGYSTRSFADYCGWSKTLIGNIERGERRLDVVEFLQLCKFLECDPHELIDLLDS